MSDRIIQGFSEMKDIYLTQILTEEKEDEDYGEKFEKKYKKTGKKSKDYDGDGDVEDEADEYAGVKDKAIKDATDDDDEKPKKKRGKKKEKEEKDDDEDMKTESFSNWRTDLYEVISKLNPEPKVKNIGNEPITEKPDVNNKITLNPTVTEKFAVIDTQELSEEFIVETSNIAAEYFVRKGINEHGLEMVIDYLGEEKFLEYVFYVAEDSLLTEATKRTPAELKALEAKRKALNAESKRKHQEVLSNRQQPKGGAIVHVPKNSSSLAKRVTTDKGDKAVETAVSTQPKGGAIVHVPKISSAVANRPKISSSNDTLKNVTRGIYNVLKQGTEEGLNRDKRGRAAAAKAKQGGKKLGGQIGAALKAAFYKPEFKEWVERLIDEGYDLSECTLGQLTERYELLLEKATSEQQQKIFGLALSVKRGDVSRSKVSDKVLEIVDGMSEAEIRKFSSTKHKGLPHKKEE
jgi:hypothetical protein